MDNDIRSTNAAVRNTQQEWLKAHKAMVAHPPRDGRVFLRHARSLIGFLEGASEAHPFAKAIVATFKGVIMYGLDRRENEARVTTVVVAQTELMRILLDLDELNKRRGGTFATESDSNILADDLYSDLMNRIRTDIKECSNTIDTYYKEKRRIGRTNGNLVWRTTSDSTVLAQLIKISNEQGDQKDKNQTEAPDAATRKDWDASSLNNIQRDLQISLKDLCEDNWSFFQSRLDLHSKNLEDSLKQTEERIIRELAGPYDRLDHKDLREFWKEMSWIFCIDNKLFTLALHEYYLDKFSSRKDELTPTIAPGGRKQRHPEAWTLSYLSRLGFRISEAIDGDNPGTDAEGLEFTSVVYISYYRMGARDEHIQDANEWDFLEALPSNCWYMLQAICNIDHTLFHLFCPTELTGIVNSDGPKPASPQEGPAVQDTNIGARLNNLEVSVKFLESGMADMKGLLEEIFRSQNIGQQDKNPAPGIQVSMPKRDENYDETYAVSDVDSDEVLGVDLSAPSPQAGSQWQDSNVNKDEEAKEDGQSAPPDAGAEKDPDIDPSAPPQSENQSEQRDDAPPRPQVQNHQDQDDPDLVRDCGSGQPSDSQYQCGDQFQSHHAGEIQGADEGEYNERTYSK
ncbi:hypothetical protein NLJ89_g6534 [Agrocybe chaxingu]|uniref:Uncharacterized protein n=1 Tax=Agrocybe chaxingu TaxID=84603 RepID=A0A9W8MSL3_9AGAR|nr:hypothetical protein NLJ89_g6534 [Agrocybe chaxingu]